MIERINLTQHPLGAQCFTTRGVDPLQPLQRLFVS